MHVYEILRRPLTTEKSNRLRDDYRKYAFEVDDRANKQQIKEAVQTAFPKITVIDVHVMKMPRKARRSLRRRSTRFTSIWKKAIVTIPANQRIDLFEGV
jgi:large subunit ribosomal protein L23